MNYLTEAKASEFACPIARVSGHEKPPARCQGSKCILWRWQPIMTNDPRWKSAMAREIALLKGEHKGEKPLSDHAANKQAAMNISSDIDAYVFRNENDRGWCGLGHKPET